MSRRLMTTIRWAAPAALAIAALTMPSAASADDDLGDVRAATVRFHSVTQAHKAGYADPGLPCFDDPEHDAGMGTHLVNGDLVDGTLSRTHPEGLVYEIRHGSLKLVAVEYIVPMSLSASPPHFLGQEMAANQALGLWTLHAWIYRDNPTGVFQPFNPDVALCPTSANVTVQRLVNDAHAAAVRGDRGTTPQTRVSAPQGRPAPTVDAASSDGRVLRMVNAAHSAAVRSQLADLLG